MKRHRKNREPARRGNAPTKGDMSRQIAALLTSNQISTSDEAEASDFIRWVLRDNWERYQQHLMNQRKSTEEDINARPWKLPNATKGKEYRSEDIPIPSGMKIEGIKGLDEVGLKWEQPGDSISIFGKPTRAGDFTITIQCTKYEGKELEGRPRPLFERKIPFCVNPNSRDLWKNVPTSRDVPYYKKDEVCEYVKVEAGADGTPRKNIVAASKRGRSHAQDAEQPRDDHFQLFHSNDNEWYIIAVADGAGSAEFSHEGSKIACRTVVDYCKGKLTNASDLEAKIRDYHSAENEESARKIVGDVLYDILCRAARSAYNAIAEEAKRADAKLKAEPKDSDDTLLHTFCKKKAIRDIAIRDFATTLLLAICKKFDFGWFVASFWVGDGAMCIYNKEAQTFKLLGTPDEGEFSGQTRFLTMPEIFDDKRDNKAGRKSPPLLYERLRFEIVEDFTALMMMTDGVSDPHFGTDANLNNINKWNEFWNALQEGCPDDETPDDEKPKVELTDGSEAQKDQLLHWLDFWQTGEHDDRTIAILY